MLMRSLAASCVISVFALPAIAETSECISIGNDLDRLACYDKASGRTPKQERMAAPPPAGKWLIQKETSAMSDRTNVVAALESDEAVNCGWNKGDKVTLIARCLENTTAIYFNTGCHMTSSSYDSYGDIQYRIDDEKAKTVRGDNSTNNRSLGLWRGATAIPLIKQMFGKSRMIVKMTPYGESPFTVSFDITGTEEATAELRKSCGW